MNRYLLIDTMNLFFRVRHTSHKDASLLDRLGMSMHIMLASANKVVRNVNVDHVIFALEGKNNWRKTFYTPYKRQRADKLQKRTESEVEKDDLYFEYFNYLIEYIDKETNCSVISAYGAEADDVIARTIALHPDDEFVILSSDTDYYQLISDKVTQYNGITSELITLDGFFKDNGKPVIDKKTKLAKIFEDPEWILFEKCIRGDKSDNIFSAYPGARKKGTKNKAGLLEAFADKNKKGYDWNAVMLHRWTDHLGKEHRVVDDYERNRKLIDLSLQPDDVIDSVDTSIITALIDNVESRKLPRQIGFKFMKFCGRHDLVKLAERPDEVISWLNKEYKGHINEYN